MPNKRTRTKKPKRKTRKGGDYGVRSMKTWQNNFDNCMNYKGMNEVTCENRMTQWDYHGKNIFGTRPDAETWGTNSRNSASRMWRRLPKNPGNHEVIPGKVKKSNGEFEVN